MYVCEHYQAAKRYALLCGLYKSDQGYTEREMHNPDSGRRQEDTVLFGPWPFTI
jgi:hypothetical protein